MCLEDGFVCSSWMNEGSSALCALQFGGALGPFALDLVNGPK